jgi:trimethylamine monooxygenase
MDTLKRIAVIGAGPAGLSQLHAFQTQKDEFRNIETVCYEKQNEEGGQWVIPPSDFDSSGEYRHSCMYKHLWSNGAKECLEYPGSEKAVDFRGSKIDVNSEIVKKKVFHINVSLYKWYNTDYSFSDHFKKPTASYPPQTVLKDYISARAKRSDILKYIRFETCIRWLSFDVAQSKFILHVEDLKTGGTQSEVFDYVVCATGHFSTPNAPYYEGLESVSI